MNLARLVLAAGPAALLCGCGTLNNSVAIFYYRLPEEPPPNYRTPDYVYGGVKIDAMAARAAVFEKDFDVFSRVLGLLMAADIPVSAVCDTLDLYRTIPATRKVAEDFRKAQELKQADFDDDGNILPVKVPGSAPESN